MAMNSPEPKLAAAGERIETAQRYIEQNALDWSDLGPLYQELDAAVRDFRVVVPKWRHASARARAHGRDVDRVRTAMLFRGRFCVLQRHHRAGNNIEMGPSEFFAFQTRDEYVGAGAIKLNGEVGGDLDALILSRLDSGGPSDFELAIDLKDRLGVFRVQLNTRGVFLVRLTPRNAKGRCDSHVVLHRESRIDSQHVPATAEQEQLAADDLCAVRENQPTGRTVTRCSL